MSKSKIVAYIKNEGIAAVFDRMLKKIGLKEELKVDKKRYEVWSNMPVEEYSQELKKWYKLKKNKI